MSIWKVLFWGSYKKTISYVEVRFEISVFKTGEILSISLRFSTGGVLHLLRSRVRRFFWVTWLCEKFVSWGPFFVGFKRHLDVWIGPYKRKWRFLMGPILYKWMAQLKGVPSFKNSNHYMEPKLSALASFFLLMPHFKGIYYTPYVSRRMT